MKKKLFVLLSAVVFFSMIVPEMYAATWCSRKVRVQFGYYMVNGPWGAGSIPPSAYTNCQQSKSPIPKTRFYWKWPDYGTRKGRVKAFNYVGIGYLNAQNKYIGSRLPKKIKDLKSFYIDYNTTWKKRNGKWNLSINMMSRNRSTVSGSRFTNEIHIFENYSGGIPSGSRLGTFSSNGATYTMRRVKNGDGNPYYQAFRAGNKKRDKGRLHIRGFINWFADKSDLNKNHWLSFIRPGAEVVRGEGDFTINNFTVTGL